ncbi:MAG: SRPBCC family protein [Candidatus Latescibacteria bacterium]|nr:SRPBCC family protein [Candidatus Latescibacterota bacterium]
MGRTYQSTTVGAPVEAVWTVLRNFYDMSWASNVVKECRAVGDKTMDQVGARRVINGIFHETLLELSDLNRTVQYRIDDGPSPLSKDEVRDYIGTVRVLPITDGNTTFVEWSSSWHGNDDRVAEFCHGIYVALLNELQHHFSGK